ncbi:MAG: SpoIVB peptidase [Clostridium sp. 28_12]|nr:MAG: SpoIVB peptidase [Clostridium sp. 28_12]
MKTLKKIFILFVLIFLYMFVLTRGYYPETIAVKGEEIKISDIQVIPVGEVIGIKLYTSGVLVVGTSEIEGIDGQKYKPYENTGIQEGDSIISVNDIIVNNTEELIDAINLYEGESVNIKYQRENDEKNCTIKPVKDKQGKYKIGLWVRDSAAGVGTLTFYCEQLKTFAALGHAITDIDTGEILQTSSGEIDNVSIVSVIKGKEEEPGKIQGAINQNSVIGNIYKNTAYGVYGVIKNPDNINIDYNKKIYVAPRQEINLGDAIILSNIDGKLKEYSVEIQRIYLNNNYDNKSMVIKIKDENLINKTGGIVQGMSGSPIIQNGKFIGAITHVFVKDPTLGYAVFADRMISELHT